MSLASAVLIALLAAPGAAMPTADAYREDARALDADIVADYAYLDRFPGGVPPTSAALTAAREAVHDSGSLLHYAEDRIASLADHHAIVGRSFRDSWAIVPTYADLWIVRDAGGYRIDAVRVDSPAARAGIRRGMTLVGVGGVPIAAAIAAFWAPLGLDDAGERGAYAARVLAAGRRDRPRELTIADGATTHAHTLASLYQGAPDRPPLTVARGPRGATIRINNSLGDQATIAAFDHALAELPEGLPLTIDLTDTPSGGNTSVARGMMSWFVDRPTSYQHHVLPAEERETGIAREWTEQVAPRAGKRHHGHITVRVGRWTGSMGEGLAIGLQAIGARLCGSPMAGLRGAVYDFTLPASGLVVKLPAERLYTVKGVPRETVVPIPGQACR